MIAVSVVLPIALPVALPFAIVIRRWKRGGKLRRMASLGEVTALSESAIKCVFQGKFFARLVAHGVGEVVDHFQLDGD